MINHMAQGKAMTIFILEMRRQSWLTQETHTLWEAKEGPNVLPLRRVKSDWLGHEGLWRAREGKPRSVLKNISAHASAVTIQCTQYCWEAGKK